jgi:hypothetical protein
MSPVLGCIKSDCGEHAGVPADQVVLGPVINSAAVLLIEANSISMIAPDWIGFLVLAEHNHSEQ